MQISVTDAKGQLTDLVRRAEAGDEIVLTRHGHPAAKLVPIASSPSIESRRDIIAKVRAAVAGKPTEGPSAARSQDFLYDEDGLPK